MFIYEINEGGLEEEISGGQLLPACEWLIQACY